MNLSNPIKEYEKTNAMVFSCQYHVIWCTKYRRPVLTNEMQERLKELIHQYANEKGNYVVIELETMSDHVHLLMSANPKFELNRLIGSIKGYTSSVLRKEFPSLKSRLPSLWTRSKFISTVGAVQLSVVKKYIENQKGK